MLTSKIVRAGETVWGTPARPLRQHLEQLANLARLPETRREVKELLEESNSLLASVMTDDQQDYEMLGARRQATAATLSATRHSGRASAAYASSRSR